MSVNSAPVRPSPAGRARRLTGSQPVVGLGTVLALAGLGLVAAMAAGRRSSRCASSNRRRQPRHRRGFDPALRQLRNGAAILAGSVLCDSAMEHFQGNYHNSAMYVAPSAAAAAMTATLAGGDHGTPSHTAEAVQATATLIGIAGLGFHAYNILKRPGGLSWNNLFYAAPVGAPGALAIAGLLGLGERRMAGRGARQGQHFVATLGGARILTGFVGAALLGTTVEVALLHFRGAFHNPAMFVPVTIPPATGTALCAMALRPPGWHSGAFGITRVLLHLTMLLGPLGTAFHAFGVSREMGGWRNWRQTLLSGPPMPAPASLSGLALAGLAALRIMRRMA